MSYVSCCCHPHSVWSCLKTATLLAQRRNYVPAIFLPSKSGSSKKRKKETAAQHVTNPALQRQVNGRQNAGGAPIMCISSIALIVFAIAALRHATQTSIDTTNDCKPVPGRATEAVKKVIDNMYDHLRREAPNDACALLDSLGQSWSLQANGSAQRTLSPKYLWLRPWRIVP